MSLSSKMPSQRQLKVGETVRQSLSELFIREDFYDSETHEEIKVTVSEVRISPDLRNATVFCMPLGGKDKEKTLQALERMTSYIRGLLAKRINLKYMPVLTFRLDKSFDEASRVEDLLNKPEVRKDLV